MTRRHHFIPARIGAAATVLAALALGGAGPAPSGREIVEQGSAGGAPACASCHGAGLGGSKTVPAIAHRPEAFILARLEHYAGPSGKNPTMRFVARALSPSERQAVAAYIANLPAAARRPGA